MPSFSFAALCMRSWAFAVLVAVLVACGSNNQKLAKEAELTGDAYFKKKDLNEAFKYYDQAVKLDTARASLYYKRGMTQAERRNYAEALKDYNRVVVHAQNQAEGTPFEDELRKIEIEKAVIEYRLNVLNNQIAAATQTIDKDPQNIDALCNRARWKARIEDFSGCIEDFSAALRVKPHDSLYLARAWAYKQDDNLREAAKDIEVAYKNNPKNLAVLMELADVEQRTGKLNEALEHLKQAQELDPNRAELWLIRAELYLKTGDLRRADGEYTAYLRAQPTDANILEKRGKLRLKMNYKDKACADFRAAVKNGSTTANDWIPRACYK